MDDILSTALAQLDNELTKRNLSIDIVICGAYAIHLLGYSRAEYTLDVDSVTELNSAEAKQLIEAVGKTLGLRPDWLNDQASTVSLPQGLHPEQRPFSTGSPLRPH
jgi:hypothetical protein